MLLHSSGDMGPCAWESTLPGLCVRQNLGELGEWTCFGFGE